MPAKNHPAYKEELKRLEYTLDYVEENLKTMTMRKSTLDKDIEQGKRHYNSESSQAYIDLMIGTMLQDRADVKLRNLIAARSKPYFARVDFKEAEKTETEKIYIGKMALIREEDQELIIVDWRAPVSNLYYEERLGDAHYISPDGDIKGQLQLKRQLSINEGKLEEMFDIDITTNDEFLQASLGSSADNRLKEIVSTIQAEQNRVIRADMWKPLIVQGAAGGGKTTIALHRIAYLIYTYERSFKPENFMIIAPSKLFLNYISDVLPELGVEKTKQTTYEEFAFSVIGQKFKINDPNQKLIQFVETNKTEEQQLYNKRLRAQSELKCSMTFKEIIDQYIETIEESFIPKEDFTLGGRVILKYEDINRLFIKDYRKHPIVKRIDEIKKHLQNRLKAQKEYLAESIQSKCDRYIVKVKQVMEPSDERQRLIVKAIDNKNEAIAKLQEISKTAVKSYIAKISKTNPLQYYKDFLKDEELFNSIMAEKTDEETASFLRSYTLGVLKTDTVDLEDIAPIMYLKYKIYGVDEKIPVRHIVIDEAQDFSVFQIYTLKHIIKDSSFTILGDLSQAIHSYRGIKDWKDISEYVFEDKSEMLTLEQSYRTSVEIMEAANKVIATLKDDKLIPAQPVIRHGEKVHVISKETKKEIAQDISAKVKELKKENFKSIAIICKTAKECEEMHSYFKKGKDSPYIITGKEKEYKSGLLIVPSYLAKGLEFDAVFVADADAENYTTSELDTKLLYVAMTRPLHKLYIYHIGEPSQLLADV
ncbi:MAG: helicase [Clostridia bacterium]|jgi:DNA helicase-2/ATP-dependent DNA helicase PcrA|nr:helicase [Clostridia bacterium]